jgi:hypothetical protein
VRTDASATTQPVSGTVTANAGSGNFTVVQSTASNLKAQVTGAGSAGTADSGVVTVQGIASMTPVQVSQATAANLNATVTGTVNLGTTAGGAGQLALDATLTGGTAKTQMYDGTNVVGTAAHPVQVSLANTAANSTAVSVSTNVTGSSTSSPTSQVNCSSAATLFSSNSSAKGRKVYNLAANGVLYILLGTGTLSGENTASFVIQPGQTWEEPVLAPGVPEYTGAIQCLLASGTNVNKTEIS